MRTSEVKPCDRTHAASEHAPALVSFALVLDTGGTAIVSLMSNSGNMVIQDANCDDMLASFHQGVKVQDSAKVEVVAVSDAEQRVKVEQVVEHDSKLDDASVRVEQVIPHDVPVSSSVQEELEEKDVVELRGEEVVTL